MTSHTDASCPLMVTATGKHPLHIQVADQFFKRLRGLMLMPPLRPSHAMLLTRCPSVHTCFMRQCLDLVYLDEQGFVTRCIGNLGAWRASSWRGKDATGKAYARAEHVLELAAGSIAVFGIEIGDRLQHEFFDYEVGMQKSTDIPLRPMTGSSPFSSNLLSSSSSSSSSSTRLSRQKGSAMIEFAFIAPIITLIGLATLQFGLIYFAKNQYNHAAFMAARAGSVAHANLDTIKDAYIQAMMPIYGGGTDSVALKKSYDKANNAMAGNFDIVMLNPTAESFADFNDPTLQQRLGLANDQRVIPNGGLAFKKVAIVRTNSGQNVQDANLLKLRITHAYKPQVPIVGSLYKRYLQWIDPGTNAFHTQHVNNGFIPIVSNVSMQMQSDAIEGATVSTPGPGNAGVATNSGTDPVRQNPPPRCNGISCGNPASDSGMENGAGGTVAENTDPVGPTETSTTTDSTGPNIPPSGNSEPASATPQYPGTGNTVPSGVCTKVLGDHLNGLAG